MHADPTPSPETQPRSRLRLAAWTGLACLCMGLLAGTAQAVERGMVPRAVGTTTDEASEARVIVKFRADDQMLRALSVERNAATPRPQFAAAMAERLRMPLRNGRVLGGRTQALAGSGMSSAALASQLAAQPEVEWAVPDMRRHIAALPNDPYLPAGQTTITPATGQWYLRAPNSTTVSAIDAVGAWDVTNGSSAVTVAVLDTGVLLDHPDLAVKMRPGYDFVRDTAISNDGDGRDGNPSDPGDWTNANECGAGIAATTSRWHGTQVAGLIGAATNNGTGMAGVGRDVMVLPVRVLGRCGGYDSDIIAAMRWAAGLSSEVGVGSSQSVPNAYPARVINMSLGSTGSCLASFRDAISELTAAGVAVVVAAGNGAGRALTTPANCPGAIAVAGLRHVGTKVGYSNLGSGVTIAAPAGNCVNLVGTCEYPLLTTTNTGTTSPLVHTYSDGNTRPSLGTSFSAPIVAGTLGLMVSVNPALSVDQMRQALQSSATPFPTTGADPGTPQCQAPTARDQDECYCTTGTCGAGMLNAARAVAAVLAPAARITAQATTLVAGTSTVLSAADSGASAGRGIASYQWSIASGAGLASLSGPTNQSTVTLVASSPGTVEVRLVVTDTLGATTATSTTLQINGTGSTVVSGGGGGGGGALEWPAIAALAAAALWQLRRKRA